MICDLLEEKRKADQREVSFTEVIVSLQEKNKGLEARTKDFESLRTGQVLGKHSSTESTEADIRPRPSKSSRTAGPSDKGGDVSGPRVKEELGEMMPKIKVKPFVPKGFYHVKEVSTPRSCSSCSLDSHLIVGKAL